jgi:DtxR family Mn-dependent transcriptional regulator
MYLKTILQLQRRYQPVRVKQIADELCVSSASATQAIQTLREKGLVLHRAYGGVRLSAEGTRVASGVEGRFQVLRDFLAEILGLDPVRAARDACEIEHVVSPETLQRLTAFLEYVGRCKLNVSQVIGHFQEYYQLRAHGDPCAECGVKPSPSDRPQ